jgi:hypothetical protein
MHKNDKFVHKMSRHRLLSEDRYVWDCLWNCWNGSRPRPGYRVGDAKKGGGAVSQGTIGFFDGANPLGQ